jgi:hypothetical protein
MMVRRWRQARKIIEEQVQARRAAGLPEPKWYEDPLLVMLAGLLASSVVAAVLALLARLLLSTVGALVVGIVLVVLLGATGLILRGLGEQLRSASLKAWGYYLGAAAYIVTATVALINGIPRLLAG